MKQLEHLPPIKKGTWLYDGSVPCEVRIVHHSVLHGSGDYEDEATVSEDQETECFYILYQTPVGQPPWVGGGSALTLDEAVLLAEEKISESIVWA